MLVSILIGHQVFYRSSGRHRHCLLREVRCFISLAGRLGELPFAFLYEHGTQDDACKKLTCFNIMFRLSVLAPSNTKLRGLVENLGVNSSFLERTRS